MLDYFRSLEQCVKVGRLEGYSGVEYADLQSLMLAIAGEENQ